MPQRSSCRTRRWAPGSNKVILSPDSTERAEEGPVQPPKGELSHLGFALQCRQERSRKALTGELRQDGDGVQTNREKGPWHRPPGLQRQVEFSDLVAGSLGRAARLQQFERYPSRARI